MYTYVDKEGFIPHIGIGNREGHLSFVSEVGVLDMLGQPVGGIRDPGFSNRSLQSSHGGKESIVLVSVLVCLLIRVCGRFGKQGLFVGKVVLITL